MYRLLIIGHNPVSTIALKHIHALLHPGCNLNTSCYNFPHHIVVQDFSMNRIPFRRYLLIAAGLLSVFMAAVGILLPLIPTTPFLLLAAACFVRSSDRLYKWLLTNPWLGPYICMYRKYRALTMQTKAGALILLWVTISFSAALVVDSWLVRAFLFLVAVGVTIHVLSLKTLTLEMAAGLESETEKCINSTAVPEKASN
jgi:uncharacterized membrane protein YbaN (DUF454 family)